MSSKSFQPFEYEEVTNIHTYFHIYNIKELMQVNPRRRQRRERGAFSRESNKFPGLMLFTVSVCFSQSKEWHTITPISFSVALKFLYLCVIFNSLYLKYKHTNWSMLCNYGNGINILISYRPYRSSTLIFIFSIYQKVFLLCVVN